MIVCHPNIFQAQLYFIRDNGHKITLNQIAMKVSMCPCIVRCVTNHQGSPCIHSFLDSFLILVITEY